MTYACELLSDKEGESMSFSFSVIFSEIKSCPVCCQVNRRHKGLELYVHMQKAIFLVKNYAKVAFVLLSSVAQDHHLEKKTV